MDGTEIVFVCNLSIFSRGKIPIFTILTKIFSDGLVQPPPRGFLTAHVDNKGEGEGFTVDILEPH